MEKYPTLHRSVPASGRYGSSSSSTCTTSTSKHTNNSRHYQPTSMLDRLFATVAYSSQLTPLLMSSKNGGEDPDTLLLDADSSSKQMLTSYEATWAIVNIFVGLGLLSQPYALAVGGWWCLLWLLLATLVCGFTGVLLALLFDHLREEGRDLNYSSLGDAAIGPIGKVAVQYAVSLELAGAALICELFMWENIAFLLPDVSPWTIAVTSTLLVLPTVFLLDFRTLSPLSLLGVVANLAMVIAIVGVFLVDPLPSSRHHHVASTDFQGTSIAVGIFLLSLAGHPCIPGVYARMERKQDIYKVVSGSFGLILATYAVVATAGYMRYGPGVSVVITENIKQNPGGVWFQLVASLIVAKTYCSISPLLSISCEVPEELLGLASDGHKRAFRGTALVLVSFIAFATKEHLAVVQAITGSTATVFVAIIVPALCYLLLLRDKKKGWGLDSIACVSLIIGGSVLSIVFLVVDVMHAVESEASHI